MSKSEFPFLAEAASRSPLAWNEFKQLLSQRIEVRADGMWLEQKGIWCDTCWHYSEDGPTYCDCGCHEPGHFDANEDDKC